MKEALKLALEALKLGDTVFYPQTSIAVAAIEKALAQQEQKPVAQITVEHYSSDFENITVDFCNLEKGVHLLYTTPPQIEERNFCSRCGKRTADLTTIHTCTPPQENT